MTATQKFAMVITTSGTVSEPSTSVVTPMLMATTLTSSFSARQENIDVTLVRSMFSDREAFSSPSHRIVVGNASSRILMKDTEFVTVELEPFDLNADKSQV